MNELLTSSTEGIGLEALLGGVVALIDEAIVVVVVAPADAAGRARRPADRPGNGVHRSGALVLVVTEVVLAPASAAAAAADAEAFEVVGESR